MIVYTRNSVGSRQKRDRGRRLAGDCVSSVSNIPFDKPNRRQAASYQTTHKSLKKLGFVGADMS
ncbi:hypothetical protein, partial [Pseudomonas viridiflava]|uniref:hypothetical protein n=1 Tax=Pseudomonas viridiflava TaxID=33069 RepID=UPI0019D05061